MQLIQELTLVQKAGVFVGIPLIVLFLLVAVRQRRAATGGGDAAAAAPSRAKRGRSKADSGIPRRKRRKLAAEAAQSMGTPVQAAQPAVAQPAAPAVEPVAIVEAAPAPPAAEPVAAPAPPPVPVVAAPADDPYVQDISLAAKQVAAFDEDTLPEVVVAAPGWPTPGELASSFDPDAFDPLPSAEPASPAPEPVEDLYDEVMIDEEPEEPEEPTGIIEMPAVPAGVYEAHEEHEIARWDGEFDPATGWDEDEAPVPVAVAAESEEWYDSDRATVGGGSSMDQPNPVDLDQFWNEAENEGPWADSSDVAVLSDMVEDESVPDWVHDDEPAAWESEPAGEVAPTPQSAPSPDIGGWTMAAPVQGSPVVLDLAGLAASGHSLELVIESSADGKGMRLRFGSPIAAEVPVADVEAVPSPAAAPEEPDADEPGGLVEEIEPYAEVEPRTASAFETTTEAEVAVELPAAEREIAAETVAQTIAEAFDVPFLTGGLPSPAEAGIVAPSADEPAADAAPPESSEVDMYGLWVEDDPVDEAVGHPEPLAEATIAPAIPDGELTEDPAKILAEIRARLAALDGRS